MSLGGYLAEVVENAVVDAETCVFNEFDASFDGNIAGVKKWLHELAACRQQNGADAGFSELILETAYLPVIDPGGLYVFEI